MKTDAYLYTDAIGETALKRSDLVRATAAALIGNTLEWYDILVYGFFALTLAKVFFPATDPTIGLLVTLGTFGVSFLIRPVGAIVLGAYADRAGRKKSLALSINLMLLGTFLLACMPSYASIGMLAPLGIMLARLLQGFSAGGEFGSSTAFLIEHAPAKYRGFIASLQFASQGLATLVASGMGYLVTTLLNPQDVLSWGWRLPFVFGLLIGPIGIYLRRHVDESPAFRASGTEPASRTPVRSLLGQQKGRVLIATGLLIVSTASAYMIQYMPAYGTKELGLPQSTGYVATFLAGLIMVFLTPAVGYLSDRFGRIRIMLLAALVYIVTAYPAFVWLGKAATPTALLMTVCLMALIKACYFAPLPALMSEVFPLQTRATGMSVSYNVGVSIFGGFAPFIAASLISLTGNRSAPSYYLVLAAALSIAALLCGRYLLKLR